MSDLKVGMLPLSGLCHPRHLAQCLLRRRDSILVSQVDTFIYIYLHIYILKILFIYF